MPGGGQPLRFRYLVRSENQATVQTSQFVQAWLTEIGIATEVQPVDDNTLTDAIYAGQFDMFHFGWTLDPDPDFILSVFTCAQRPPDGIWSDSFYCDPGYDRLYAEQKTIADVQDRAQVLDVMERQIYRDVPYIVLWYPKELQAYRSDRWTGFVPQPAPDGDLLSGYGNYTFVQVRPIAVPSATPEASPRGGGGGRGYLPWVVIGLVIVPVVVLVVAVARRRRESREDRA
jgi:peptide/nickel transport system substrate-binding protein